MNATAGALLRFWWLVIAGIAAGVLVAVFVYSLQSQAKHTATTRVFVSSPSAPYLRTQQPQSLAPRVRTVRNAGGGTRTVQQPPTASSEAPDTQTLVNAANLYPLLIESDRIATIRESQAGTIPGTVKANALNSSTNTFGVFRPSSLPIVEVKATSRTAANASRAGDRDRDGLRDLDQGAAAPLRDSVGTADHRHPASGAGADDDRRALLGAAALRRGARPARLLRPRGDRGQRAPCP